YVNGALFSTGDGHFAQGDGEVCITAVEMGATVAMKFRIHYGEAARKNIQAPRFSHSGYFNDPKWAAPRNIVGTMGMPIKQDGSNDPERQTTPCWWQSQAALTPAPAVALFAMTCARVTGENLNLATRNAILQMIDLLAERGYTREQAYCIGSVAVDRRISNVVDVPNFVVSALLPEEIFVK